MTPNRRALLVIAGLALLSSGASVVTCYTSAADYDRLHHLTSGPLCNALDADPHATEDGLRVLASADPEQAAYALQHRVVIRVVDGASFRKCFGSGPRAMTEPSLRVFVDRDQAPDAVMVAVRIAHELVHVLHSDAAARASAHTILRHTALSEEGEGFSAAARVAWRLGRWPTALATAVNAVFAGTPWLGVVLLISAVALLLRGVSREGSTSAAQAPSSLLIRDR